MAGEGQAVSIDQRGEHRRLEETYASGSERYRRNGGRHPVRHDEHEWACRDAHGFEHEDRAQDVEGPVAYSQRREF